jgi:hypothetical protein
VHYGTAYETVSSVVRELGKVNRREGRKGSVTSALVASWRFDANLGFPHRLEPCAGQLDRPCPSTCRKLPRTALLSPWSALVSHIGTWTELCSALLSSALSGAFCKLICSCQLPGQQDGTVWAFWWAVGCCRRLPWDRTPGTCGRHSRELPGSRNSYPGHKLGCDRLVSSSSSKLHTSCVDLPGPSYERIRPLPVVRRAARSTRSRQVTDQHPVRTRAYVLLLRYRRIRIEDSR